MTRLLDHLRKYTTRGVVAVIPIVIVAGLLYLIYDLIDKNAGKLVSQFLGVEFPGVGILLLVVLLYSVGLLASSLVGRLVFGLLDSASRRIPMVGSAYGVGKQLSTTLTLPEGELFRRAVLIRFLNQQTWTIGFVTGSITDNAAGGSKCLTVFVPTPPNPFSGTMVIVPEADTRDPGWSIEQALRSVLSGGLLAPASFD